ncbi:MAG: phosphotransferase [Bacilli bacterium]|nr:phosphotransferase [Bacilli bacterium]
MKKLKKIISNEYLIHVLKIEKNIESTQGNVYIIYTKNNKYVLKIYYDINHVKSMTQLHNDISNKFNVPNIIKNKDNKSYVFFDSKYLVLYSFLEGIQIGKLILDSELVKKIALELRRMHDFIKVNNYNLNKVPFNDYNLKRKSLLHFDLTKGNIFYNQGEIGFIDFDDAKYGSSVCDVAILVALLFFSKNRGVDIEGLNVFIDSYYGKDLSLKLNEIKHIREIAINWVNYTLENNEFNASTTESFEVKKKLIEENLFNKKLIPFKECIGQKLYEMYQDIPFQEIGSINELKGVCYEEFLKISKKYIDEETNINKQFNTTTKRYILYIDNLPVGEVGIRTTINDYWENRGSQIYYKIRLSERGKKYGDIILNLALKEAKKIGFKKIRINCDTKNMASKKIILKNGGKEDIVNYKTKDGYSTSYIININ